jgi:N-acyl-D-amino-acid deacylase
LAREAASRDKLYSSHIRDESNYSVSLFNAIEEAIAIGRQSGVRVQISHLKCLGRPTWGRAQDVLDRIARARKEGLDVASDQYPYTATSTGLSGAIFPRWSQVGGREILIKNLSDKAFLIRLYEGIKENIDRRGGAEHIVIARYVPNPKFEGLDLVEIGRILECNPIEAAIRIYQGSDAQVVSHSLQESDLETIARDPWIAVGSDGDSVSVDGILSLGRPHPRSYGTFPRFLGRYTRERNLVTLAEAIRKMTLLPANRLGLTHRGRVMPGAWADLVVFNPDTVSDLATFDKPHAYPLGIRDVVVNGIPAVLNAEYTGNRAGKVIRKFGD